MLVNSKKDVRRSQSRTLRSPSNNIVNLENIKGVIEVAEETKHPLMVCVYGGTYTDIRY